MQPEAITELSDKTINVPSTSGRLNSHSPIEGAGRGKDFERGSRYCTTGMGGAGEDNSSLDLLFVTPEIPTVVDS